MRFIFIFLAVLSCLEAKIVQTNRIEDALAHLNTSSWLLLDIDDTLLEAENQLGRVSWAVHEFQKSVRQGINPEAAQKGVFSEWVLIQIICPSRTVEPTTAAVVAKAQEIAEHVLGITARPPAIAALSAEMLSKLRIDLSKSAPDFPVHFNRGETAYRNGIWFLSDLSSKAESFARMLAARSTDNPKRVVFIDDQRQYLEEMETALKSMKIEFIGLHYVKAHERPFNPAIADLQRSRLPEILSDAKALQLMKDFSSAKS